MKKSIVLLLLSMTLCCVPVLAQESSDEKSLVPEVSVVARFDANPAIPFFDNAKPLFDPAEFFYASALYTFMDGNLSEHFAYSLGFNWLSAELRSMYIVDYEDGTSKANLFYSDRHNWLGWANVSFIAEGFELRVGKDYLAIGNLECDEFDFDVLWNSGSYFWMNYNSFNWGATAFYTLPDKKNTFALQFQTSPFGEKAFVSNLFTYSLQWRGEYDWGTFLYSTNLFQDTPNSYIKVIALGQEFYLGDFTVRLDYMSRARNLETFFNEEQAVKLDVYYELSDNLMLGLWGAGDFIMGEKAFLTNEENLGTLWSAGIATKWYPFDGFRIHGLVGYNNYLYESCLSLNFGVTYNLQLNKSSSR